MALDPHSQPDPGPTALALRTLTETRHWLRVLIRSSESFDYPTAKQALAELEKNLRSLARAQQKVEASLGRTRDPGEVLEFPRRT